MANKTIYSVCGICTYECLIQVEIKKNNCQFIQGNQNILPNSNGVICHRGLNSITQLLNNNRPQFPLQRQGKRGEGYWKRINWNQAFDIIAKQIYNIINSKFGPKSIIWSDKGGSFNDIRKSFVKAIKSPNYFTANSYHSNNQKFASLSLFGFENNQLIYDYRQAKQIVMQNMNPFESINVKEINEITAGLQFGAKLTVIDIRASITACKANHFIIIRPGTDYLFNLGIINILITKKLFNTKYIYQWISKKSLDFLSDFTTPYNPEFIQNETGVKTEDLINLTHELAKNAPAIIWHPSKNSARYNDSFYLTRSIYIINALLGSIGTKGGLPLLVKPHHLNRQGLNKFSDIFSTPSDIRIDKQKDHFQHLPSNPNLLHAAFKSIIDKKSYPIKAYISYNHNPLYDYPEPEYIKKTLEKIDFLVSITNNWSDISWQSDIVLPLANFLECESPLGEKNGFIPTFIQRQQCVSPKFDTKPAYEIIINLAKRLSIQELIFNSIEDIWEWQLKNTGISINEFKKTGFVALTNKLFYRLIDDMYKFPNDSGMIEIINPKWENYGIPSLIPYTIRPKLSLGQFYLIIGQPKYLYDINSNFDNSLHKEESNNIIWINYDIARILNIQENDYVKIKIGNRLTIVKAHLNKFIHPEAIYLFKNLNQYNLTTELYRQNISEVNLLPSGSLTKITKASGSLALQEYIVTIN